MDSRLTVSSSSSSNAAVGPRTIFLSYARADGRAVAEDLCVRLKALGHSVWQDVVDMAGGQDWWAQIEDRIHQAGTAVLVVTPAAMTSRVVRREWLHARRVGTPCLPITNDAHVFATAPRWLRNVDVFVLAAGQPDFDATWRRFLDQVDVPPPIRPVPFMAPGLPAEFVARIDSRDGVVSLMLNERQDEPTGSTTILEAPPGFGKTVLAQEVCHDQRIIDTFTGGILWVTLGERGQGALPGLNALVGALSGTNVTFNTVEQGEPRLTELLQSRDCLLVLDDVWDVAHAKPFLVSTNVTRLITTRNAQDVTVQSASVRVLDEMTPDEATLMLLNFVPSEVRDKDLDGIRLPLADLARRLGEWPLLLGIFGGTLQTEISVRRRAFVDAMKWIREGLESVGLTAFDRRRSEDRNAALAKSVDVSLRPYSEDERQRLFELAVFPPGEMIPETVVLRLWRTTASMTAFSAGRLLRELGGTFFRLNEAASSGSLVLRFHDALREHLADRLTPTRASEVHRLLLGSYFAPDASPATVPDDGYLYDHVAYHLRYGQSRRLHDLLREPEWFRARFAHRAHTYDGFLADVAHASDAAFDGAYEDIEAGAPPRAVAELTRYRLVQATVDELASLQPRELVVRALELGLRTPAQAVSLAARVPDPKDRIGMLQRLLSIGSPFQEYRHDLEALAAQTVDGWREPSVYVLTDLADSLQGPARAAVLRRALRVATETIAIRTERSRASRALGIYDSYSADRELAHGLAAVARRLDGEQRRATTRDGLAAARRICDSKERAHALAAWVGITLDADGDCSQEAVDAAGQIDNQQERLFALSAIARNAGRDRQLQLLDRIWREALTIEDEPWRAFCLSRAAAQFDADRRRQCVELALRSLEIDRARQAEAARRGGIRRSTVQPLLEELNPSLSPQDLAVLREVIERTPTDTPTARIMLDLDLPLTDADVVELFDQVVEERKQWYGEDQWPREIAKLAPHLPATLLATALAEGAHLMAARAWPLTELEANVTGQAISGRDLGGPAQDDAASPDDGGADANRPPDPGASLRGGELRAELERIRGLTDKSPIWKDRAQTYALLPIIAELPEAEVDEAWGIAAAIGDGWYRSQPLAALARRLSGDRRERAASEAIDALLEPGPANADRRAFVIENLIPVLSAGLVARLFAGVQSFEEWGRIRALKALFLVARPEHLEAALDATRNLSNDRSKAELLPLLVSSADDEQLMAIGEAAETIGEESARVKVLESITSNVRDRAAPRVLSAVERLTLPEHRARVRARLLSVGPDRDGLLADVRRDLVEHLHHGPRSTRVHLLQFLADRHVVAEPVLDEATIRGVVQAATDVCRHWPWE